ncbi:FecCD family ABC transporter permease [Virgibacillus halodenitrificans]|jgi:iron complex transport system permease protein|uniref:FecCD family ABC transporter permease n=1 Tax=Virgibacillus halodenitrificans TaxID=1482 RepID=UPI0024C087DC|nr:iron ABC transporter permease [Virgibacillus halodenitrificans]MEC2159631.1 iron ABC transporter permease [Virgibacillus halodenitrificans]WHX26317.1 iron ABC transporter permease [Virgibacillus halodenitrificans]
MIKSNANKIIVLTIGVLLVVFLMWASTIFGLTKVTTQTLVNSIYHFDGSNEHIIIQQARIPRALIAAAVGGSLAIAGAIMQGLTNNPLASPSLFGVNAGASFLVVVGISFLGFTSSGSFTWLAFAGAAVSSIIVYVLGSMGRDGITPIKITLAGAAIAALFSSLTQGILTLNESALDQVLFWLAGSVQGRDLDVLIGVLPYLILGWFASIFIGKQMNVLTMGEDIAKGLGQKTLLIKIVGAIIVVLLAGGSVAIAGPIGFIGIVIPHISRWFVGIDYRWIIPYSGLLGAMLLLMADIAARYIIMPAEVPVGVMTAFIGVPFFIYIARRGINE